MGEDDYPSLTLTSLPPPPPASAPPPGSSSIQPVRTWGSFCNVTHFSHCTRQNGEYPGTSKTMRLSLALGKKGRGRKVGKEGSVALGTSIWHLPSSSLSYLLSLLFLLQWDLQVFRIFSLSLPPLPSLLPSSASVRVSGYVRDGRERHQQRDVKKHEGKLQLHRNSETIWRIPLSSFPSQLPRPKEHPFFFFFFFFFCLFVGNDDSRFAFLFSLPFFFFFFLSFFFMSSLSLSAASSPPSTVLFFSLYFCVDTSVRASERERERERERETSSQLTRN